MPYFLQEWEALEQMHARGYDLLVFDSKVPEMDVAQLIRAIQKEGQDKASIPVIMVSA